jgi:hypothetical protein
LTHPAPADVDVGQLFKFGWLGPDKIDGAFEYPDIWCRESTRGPDRLVIAPSCDHVGLMLELSGDWPGPRKILYVLVVSRCGAETGRYESPVLTALEARGFLEDHRRFLERDARHHVWLAAPDRSLLVYDRHNVIFAYGDLAAYERVVRRRGMRESAVKYPVPHSHHYHKDFDAEERRVLAALDWARSPLIDEHDDP